MKFTLLILGVVLIGGVIAFLAGCGSHKGDEKSMKLVEPVEPAEPGKAAEPVEVPYVVKEAGLPVGYPPPGPVGRIIVKHYPAYRAAVQQAMTPEGRKTPNGMFSPLFNHIKKNDIAMTAPVEMTYNEGETQPMSMAFLYGDPAWGKTGQDATVQVVDLPPLTVISIGLRGGYDQENFQRGLAQLQQWLKDHPGRYTQAGPARYLGYNSPFIPGFFKYGEVQIPVK